ncbi:MAG TPA: hypothetical protein VMS37_14290 [Verrucomicrobiae bacterium]|nr:hypothetical protein [Verrucomicrobiae bacterium]
MTTYQGRRCASIENEHLRVSVLQEGGHIAEIFDRETRVNPLWTPPWTSLEPSAFDPGKHGRAYGSGAEAKLLAGIMGHNLCLDIFGGPSAEEASAGLTVHGEGSVVSYKVSSRGDALIFRAKLPQAGMAFERSIELGERSVIIRESVENLTACDRPIGWTQHVTLGPPFLKRGATEFRASATLSKVFEGEFGKHDYLQAGGEFDWPHAPRIAGGTADLRVMNGDRASSGFTTHLMDPARENAFFVAFSPAKRLAFGYVWKQADFPWLGIWEENHSRRQAPWKGKTLARGMEFGVSPIPESRRQMIERGRLFGVPTYRWLPAKSRIEVQYRAFATPADVIPETIG